MTSTTTPSGGGGGGGGGGGSGGNQPHNQSSSQGGGGTSSSGGGQSAGGNVVMNKQLPRDALVMQSILKEFGIVHYEPRVVHQMLDFVYRYVTNVVEEARAYSSYAKKKTIDVDDVKLAVKMINENSFTSIPPREMLLELAKSKNSQPLPLLKSTSGLRLPPDRFCLTQPNYHLEFYKKAIASSASKPPVSSVRLPGSSGVFKTPQSPAVRMVTSRAPGSSIAASTSNPPVMMQYNPASGNLIQQSQGVKRKLSDDGTNN